jgi:hypothetical protein
VKSKQPNVRKTIDRFQAGAKTHYPVVKFKTMKIIHQNFVKFKTNWASSSALIAQREKIRWSLTTS